MSDRARNGHGADEALDDATVEQVLAGRYEGDAADLVTVSDLLGQVRSFAERPAPPPSASLAGILSDSSPASGGALRTMSRPTPARHRWRPSYPPIVAAAVVAVLAAIVVGAGSARLLPGPIQEVVASIVRAMTPFDFPEQRNPETVSSKAQGPETASPSQEPTARVPGDSSQPGTGAPETNGSQRVPGDGTGSRSQPGGGNAAPTPAPTGAEANGPSSDGVSGLVPPPPPGRRGFSADLVGVMGAETAGDVDGRGKAALDAHPGRDELCLTLVVSGIAPVTAVHLHAQSTGVSGPVVAAWTEPTAGASAGCVRVTDELIKKIRKQPGNYYVDVHTTEFPNGAVRGPLTK